MADSAIKFSDNPRLARELANEIRHPERLSARNLYYIAYELYCMHRSQRFGYDDGGFIRTAEALEYLAKEDGYNRAVVEKVCAALKDYENRPGQERKSVVDEDDLYHFLLTASVKDGIYADESTTPTSLCNLVIGLLDIEQGDRVGDLGCGEGVFLSRAISEYPESSFTGVDLDSDAVEIARIRTRLASSYTKCEIVEDNMFDDEFCRRFDKAFSNYPIGLNMRDLIGDSSYLSRIRQGLPEYGRPSSLDWAFNRLLFDSIVPDGRAIGIMTTAATVNGRDRRIRQYFVENGMIEGVIALPSNLFAHTRVSMSMIVLSHNNNSIKFVDATSLCHEGHRRSHFTEDDVAEIIDQFKSPSTFGSFIANEEVLARNCDLNASHYVGDEVELVNPIPLKELATSIARGAQIVSAELDALKTSDSVPYRYLTVRNLEDGQVSSKPISIKEVTPRLERHRVETGDLLIAKFGNRADGRVKVAVASVPADEEWFAGSNMYVVKVDSNKIDSYYIASFLMSARGRAVLERASVDSGAAAFAITSINEIPVPMVSSDVQDRIAARCRSRIDEIRVLKKRLNQARAEVEQLFDEEA